MHMRVVIEIAFMGMEDSMGTAAATQLWIATCKAIERLPGGFEQQIVGNPLMCPEELPQLRWYSEGNHVIVNRQQSCLLPLQPLLAFMLLAMGTTAVAAGMGQAHLMVAAIAFQHHHAAVLIAATAHSLQGPMMAW
jgi:hypothetical protein